MNPINARQYALAVSQMIGTIRRRSDHHTLSHAYSDALGVVCASFGMGDLKSALASLDSSLDAVCGHFGRPDLDSVLAHVPTGWESIDTSISDELDACECFPTDDADDDILLAVLSSIVI